VVQRQYRLAQKVEIGCDVHLLGVVASERFSEVENEIRFALGQRRQTLRGTIQYLIRWLMTKLFESLENFFAVFLLALGFLPGFFLTCGWLGWGGSGTAPSPPTRHKEQQFSLQT